MVDGQYFAASRRGYPSNHAPGAQDITLCDVSSGKVYVGRLFNRLHGVRQGEPPTATVDLSTGPSSGFRTSTQVKPSTPPTASAAPEDRSSRRTRTAGSGRAAPPSGQFATPVGSAAKGLPRAGGHTCPRVDDWRSLSSRWSAIPPDCPHTQSPPCVRSITSGVPSSRRQQPCAPPTSRQGVRERDADEVLKDRRGEPEHRDQASRERQEFSPMLDTATGAVPAMR